MSLIRSTTRSKAVATAINQAVYQDELQLARKREQHPKSLIGRGSTHRAAVRGVQERLSELGYEVSIDGVFGDETEKALKEFQTSRNAKVDGVVGRETLGKLIRATKPKSKKTADTAIDAIQRVVTAGRPKPARSGRALGDMKAESEGGGRAFRVPKGPHGGSIDANGLERASNKTGPIGSSTIVKPKQASWEKDGADPLKPETGGAPTNEDFESKHPRVAGKFAKKGDSGEEVKNTQTALNQVGKAGLAEDGDFGPKTDKMLRQYQRTVGLTVDGIAGPKTAASLRRRLKLANKANADTQTKKRPRQTV